MESLLVALWFVSAAVFLAWIVREWMGRRQRRHR
jgi:hypothetical protein